MPLLIEVLERSRWLVIQAMQHELERYNVAPQPLRVEIEPLSDGDGPWRIRVYSKVDREQLAKRIEEEVGTLVAMEKYDQDENGNWGYNCCGCSTYQQIIDHAVRLVREWEPSAS